MLQKVGQNAQPYMQEVRQVWRDFNDLTVRLNLVNNTSYLQTLHLNYTFQANKLVMWTCV